MSAAKTSRNAKILKLAGKMSLQEIADKFDITHQCVHQIIVRSGIEVVRTFKHKPRRKPVPWTCKGCGKYHPEGYKRNYCDDKCRPIPETRKIQKLECAGCGKKYERTVREHKQNRRMGSKRDFHSQQCYYKNGKKK